MCLNQTPGPKQTETRTRMGTCPKAFDGQVKRASRPVRRISRELDLTNASTLLIELFERREILSDWVIASLIMCSGFATYFKSKKNNLGFVRRNSSVQCCYGVPSPARSVPSSSVPGGRRTDAQRAGVHQVA